MKNSVNNQPASNNAVNFAIVNNPQSAYKYIKRETLIEDYHTLILGCSKANVEVEAIANPDQISKKSLIDSYVTIAQKYMEVVTVQEEPVAEEAPVETIQVQEEVKVEDPAPKAEKKTKEESGESKGHRGTAEERLAKYGAELKEKEAIENPSKEVRKRIASLKRKIERAEKALKA